MTSHYRYYVLRCGSPGVTLRCGTLLPPRSAACVYHAGFSSSNPPVPRAWPAAATFPDPITITFGEVDPDLGGADRTGLPHTSGSAGFTFFGFNYAKCSAVKQVGAEKGLPGLESFCNDTWALVSQPDTFARGVARYDFWTFDMTSIRIGSA